MKNSSTMRDGLFNIYNLMHLLGLEIALVSQLVAFPSSNKQKKERLQLFHSNSKESLIMNHLKRLPKRA